MNEQQALERMVPPGKERPRKWRGGIIQIHITRACDQSCFGCTQGSNLGGKPVVMTPDQFDKACQSLKGYWGVIGVFGGNPAVHPQFNTICEILANHFPKEQRGLWCNNPMSMEKTLMMRHTFNPNVSNLNVHMDRSAFDMFKKYWPESRPFGLDTDSRHSPPFVAMKDVVKKNCEGCNGCGTKIYWREVVAKEESHQYPATCDECNGSGKVLDESRIWDLISNCDINQHWSALIGVFRGELRAWFCEIAGAQSMLHQHEPDYPDTGLDPTIDYEHETAPGDRIEKTLGKWWQLGMVHFKNQVRKHCFDCGVPLKGYGELALSSSPESKEQVSETHNDIYKPKRTDRRVEIVTELQQLDCGKLQLSTDYIGNARR